jgi:hypothetical protein
VPRVGELVSLLDTSALRSDLVPLLEVLGAFLHSSLGGAHIQSPALAHDSPEMIAARQTFWRSRFALLRAISERAVERGEIAASLDRDLMKELFVGPVNARLLLTGESLQARFPEQIVDLVLHGIAKRTPPADAQTGPSSYPSAVTGAMPGGVPSRERPR